MEVKMRADLYGKNKRLVAEILYYEFGKEPHRRGLVYRIENDNGFTWQPELYDREHATGKWLLARKVYATCKSYNEAATALDLDNEGSFVKVVTP